MPAFTITESNGATVYFAPSEGDALEEWKSEVGACGECDAYACECYSVEIKRDKFFDEYEGKGEIPLQAYCDAWWAWTCAPCCEQDMHRFNEPYGPGDWQVVDGVPMCNECAKEAKGNRNETSKTQTP